MRKWINKIVDFFSITPPEDKEPHMYMVYHEGKTQNYPVKAFFRLENALYFIQDSNNKKLYIKEIKIENDRNSI